MWMEWLTRRMEDAAPRKDVKRVYAKYFVKNHVLSQNISDGYAVRFFFANNEERFHRACTNGILTNIAKVRSIAPNMRIMRKARSIHRALHLYGQYATEYNILMMSKG